MYRQARLIYVYNISLIFMFIHVAAVHRLLPVLYCPMPGQSWPTYHDERLRHSAWSSWPSEIVSSVYIGCLNKYISLEYILLVTPSMAPKVGHDNYILAGDIFLNKLQI